jgi:carboxyl-terminal processing protease
MPRSFKLSILAISVGLVVFIFLGGFMPGGVRASTDNNAYRQIEVYSEVLQHIQNDYVVTPDIHDVSVGALHGLLEGLDPDSSFLTAQEYKDYQALENAGKAQVGMDISKHFDYATVVTVVPGSAADKAAIKDGDVIESIGGKSTRVMSLAMARLLLEGQPGSQVTFSVVRPTSAEPESLTLTRSLVQYPQMGVEQYENSSILYLRPYQMSKERVDQMVDRLRAMPKDGNQKVLLDLRDVAEGEMAPAMLLANAFLQTGTIATLEGQRSPKQTFSADPKKFVTAAPLVVLVNHGTAGPAEIVAAALLDNKRADIVGDHTFGAGVVQKQIPLPGGEMLFLTVAKYSSPSGTVVQEKGVTPNVEVAASNENFFGAAPTQTKAPASGPQPPAAAPPDEQLNKALALLRQKSA